MTLDEWTEKNCPKLEEAIRCHLNVYSDGEAEDFDVESCLRVIMISVRQEWPKK